MKLRLLPILLTVACSSVLLFGGWFVYRSYAMETPLTQIVSEAPGVENVTMDLTNESVHINLKLNEQANLRELYQKLEQEGAGIIGKRNLDVKITNESSPELEKWWSVVLFDIAQAMETRQYAQIPQTLADKAASLPGLKTESEMDAKNVYIELTYNGKSKFIILPRVSAKIGVWPNE